MRTMIPAAALVAALAALVGCADDGVQESFEDFVDDVRAAAGPNAEACPADGPSGDESGESAAACVARAFGNGTPAWAIETESGLRSTLARGVATDADAAVTLFTYDSDPFGGGSVPDPESDAERCESPRLSGTVDADLFDAFVCGG